MPSIDTVFHFGSFSLHPAARLLSDGGRPVALGARALDILIALVQQAGQVVSKEELFSTVWPDTVVEEISLRVHVAALRKALGGPVAQWIENAPGKGYRFAGDVRSGAVATASSLSTAARSSRLELPVRLTRMIGRSGTVEGIASMLLTQRLVTITGEGGVGKTTLALAVAESTKDEYADGAVFVDLAVAAAADQLVSAFSRALGLPAPLKSPSSLLGESIGNQALLLVIDNCEHLVVDVAPLVAELLATCPALRVLATSREALRIGGEQIHRLESLPSPPAVPRLTAAEALRYASIQLLVERVSAASGGFTLSDADAEPAAELCRTLDGVPLAIELAAARVGFFGLHGLLTRLPDRLRILNAGHRTGMPRHQTLRALYDWSFNLLADPAKEAFARISVFPGSFSLEAAMRLMPWEDRAKALTLFLDLVSKSLVDVELGSETRRYRLLDTARVYAREKLQSLGLERECRLVHADWLLQTLDAANRDWVRESSKPWLDRHAPLYEDVAATLQWLSSEPEHSIVFARLTVSAYQLAQQLSQLDTLRQYVKRALTQLQGMPDAPEELRIELLALYGLWLGCGHSTQQEFDQWLAESTRQIEAGARARSLLLIVSIASLAQGQYRQLLKTAEHFEAAAHLDGDRQATVIARRLQAQAHHFLGDFAVSKHLAHDVLAFPGGSTLRHGRFLDAVDRRLSMGIVLARTHWLEGRTAEANAGVQACMELAAGEIDQAKCQFLALAAIPIALWCGDNELAAVRLDELRSINARQPALDYWTEWVSAFDGVLSVGTVFQPIRCLKLLDQVGTLSPGFHDQRLLPRAESGVAGWSAPEVIRAHGQRLLAASPTHAGQARQRFLRALELARACGAVRWELRAAASLAELDLQLGQPAQSEPHLLTALGKMPASGDDADIQKARRLLEAREQPGEPIAAHLRSTRPARG